MTTNTILSGMRGDVVHVKKSAGVFMCEDSFLSGVITSGLPILLSISIQILVLQGSKCQGVFYSSNEDVRREDLGYAPQEAIRFVRLPLRGAVTDQISCPLTFDCQR